MQIIKLKNQPIVLSVKTNTEEYINDNCEIEKSTKVYLYSVEQLLQLLKSHKGL